MMQKIHSALLLLFAISSLCMAQDEGYRCLNPSDFSLDRDQQVFSILVDVRMKMEYRKSHLPGAVNVPSKEMLLLFADTLDREIPLYLYCTTDTRSRSAAEFLVSADFVNVCILQGGLKEWIAYGMPVEGRRARKINKKNKAY